MINKDVVEKISKMIMRTGALKFGVFELASGAISPYYLDLRLIPGEPLSFASTIDMLEEKILQIGRNNFERIGAVPTAGIPYAGALSYKMKKPFLYVRKETKSHGTQKMVEGLLMPGDRVILIDDLVTTGHSLVDASRAIRLEGGLVEHAVVIIDRLEGGERLLRDNGVQLHALVSIREVIDKLREMDAIEKEDYESILDRIYKEQFSHSL
ncbi:MAG: orotate phosphoribosyltransferase [Thermoproteota archaeon]